MLAGGIFSNDDSNFQTLRIEASRRINNNWKWEVELKSIFNTQPDQPIHNFKDDDYLQVGISYYF